MERLQSLNAEISKLEQARSKRKPITNVNDEHGKKLSVLDRLAIFVTERVGTMGFFLLILLWTILWCGFNILASEVPTLHWKPFDPFPAFVAYLLMSNVIQILLMPLIMVGQNLQGRHSELRAEHDLDVNIRAEEEIEMILLRLQLQQELLMHLVKAQGIQLDAITAQHLKDSQPQSPADPASEKV